MPVNGFKDLNKTKIAPDSILFVMDHDLGFLLEVLIKTVPWTFVSKKIESFESLSSENSSSIPDLEKAQWIFVFLKFSPRLREKSIKIFKELIKLNSKPKMLALFFRNICNQVRS